MRKHQLKIYSFNEDALPLKNEGELSFYFFGTGSAFAKTLFQNNIVIIKGNTSIFIDFGTRAPEALSKLDLNVSNIDNLILTHSHADHVGGVEEIALMNRYFYKKKPNLYIPRPYEKLLWEESLSGGCKYSEIKEDGQYLSIHDFFNVIYPKNLKKEKLFPDNRDAYEIKIGDVDLIYFRTKHIPSGVDDPNKCQLSYGLCVDKTVIFSSDTIFDKIMLDSLMKKFDIQVIFHDCQFYPGGVHAPYEDLKTLSPETKKIMYLMHYGDNFRQMNPSLDGFAGFALQHHFYSLYNSK